MVRQHAAVAPANGFFALSPALHESASDYQRLRAVEADHLAMMARHNLLDEWSGETRATVLEARERVREARVARERFREQLRAIVAERRAERESLPLVLRHIRRTLRVLESAGALQADAGWLEAEVVEWAIHDYEAN